VASRSRWSNAADVITARARSLERRTARRTRDPARPRRRGDRMRRCLLHRVMTRLAQSGQTTTAVATSAVRGKAVMRQGNDARLRFHNLSFRESKSLRHRPCGLVVRTRFIRSFPGSRLRAADIGLR
jgi:hypothetical protein